MELEEMDSWIETMAELDVVESEMLREIIKENRHRRSNNPGLVMMSATANSRGHHFTIRKNNPDRIKHSAARSPVRVKKQAHALFQPSH